MYKRQVPGPRDVEGKVAAAEFVPDVGDFIAAGRRGQPLRVNRQVEAQLSLIHI